MGKQRQTDTTSGRGEAPPASLEEALARAQRHGRNAASETLAMVQALLDAASLAASGKPATSHAGLATLARTLDGWSSRLSSGRDAGSLLASLAEALDAEISRWEELARGEDPEARAVLRAFLGVRELLWELGVRSPERASPPDRPRGGGRGSPPRRSPRVQRVTVEG